jgi:hypothetical protein
MLRSVHRLALCLALGLALLVSPAEARAPRRKVVWSSIVVPAARKDQARLEATLKQVLEAEGKKARWGKRGAEAVEASLDLRQFTTTIHGDIAHISCAATGKIKGFGPVKSRFSFGGSAAEQGALEKHVLEILARGIIQRLAEMARSQDAGWTVTH